MKKTLTKTTALLLVFAMLLSVFAVFAGSASAAPNNGWGGYKPEKKEISEWLKEDVRGKVEDKVEEIKSFFMNLPGELVEKFESDVNAAAADIKKPLDLMSTVNVDDAITALETMAITYTNPFPADGETPHKLAESKVVEKLNDVFGINLLLEKARWALRRYERWIGDEAGVVERAEFDNLVAGYTAELKALVKLRDDKCHLLLNVVVAGGKVTTPIINTVSAVVSLAVLPQRVMNIGVEAKSLFEKAAGVAEFVKYFVGEDGKTEITKHTFKQLMRSISGVSSDAFNLGTKAAGAVLGVKAAVETVKNFPATVGAIGDNLQAYGAAIQTLFNYVFKLA